MEIHYGNNLDKTNYTFWFFVSILKWWYSFFKNPLIYCIYNYTYPSPSHVKSRSSRTRNLLNIGVKLGSMICFCRRSSVSLSTLLSSSSTGLQSDQNQIILRNNHINYKQQFLNTLRTNFVNPIRYLQHNTRCLYWEVQSEVSALNVYHVLEQNANITSKI